MPGKRKLKRKTIVLVGAGRMGTALLKGWIARKLGPVVVVEPNPSPELRRLTKSKRISLLGKIEDVDASAVGVCVVAIKPQVLRSEGARLRAFADQGALILSIAAGTSTQSFAKACGAKARIIRSMPNLPGSIGKGISALYATPKATPKDRAEAEALLAALGDVVWVKKETMIDTVTAVSGSGPAYVFLMVEALAAAAEREGLPRPLALQACPCDHRGRRRAPGLDRQAGLRTAPRRDQPRRDDRSGARRPHGAGCAFRVNRSGRRGRAQTGARTQHLKVKAMTIDPELRRLRDSIDNIDAALVHLLAERFKCTQRVGEFKATHGLPPADPGREAEQIERLRKLAATAKLDPDFAEKFLAFIVQEVIRHHEAIRAK